MICSERVIPPERQHSVPPTARRRSPELHPRDAVADSSLPNLPKMARYHSLLKTPLLATFLLQSVVCAPQWDDRSYIAAVSAFSVINFHFLPRAVRWLWPGTVGVPGIFIWTSGKRRFGRTAKPPGGPCDETTPVTQRPGNSIYPSWGSEWP
jgi:hypothetical protein